ncbi:MAG: hypothetical protein GY861_05510 [bacterium]|nr:hypothetical protein [bacterium]
MKYFKNSSTEDNAVDLLLYGDIGWEVKGSDFAKEVAELPSEVAKINVRINTNGGFVTDGMSMYTSLKNAKQEVHTFNDGVAASMGGIILMAGDEIHAMDYSRLMIHPVSGGSDKGRKSLQDMLVGILAMRSGIETEEVEEMMKSETWLTAKEAKKKGFIDNIVKSSNNYDLNASLVNQMVNSISKPKEEEINIDNKNTNKMEEIKNTLQLDPNASNEVANKKVKEILNENKELKASNETLETEKKDSELANEQLKEQNITLQGKVDAHKEEKETENKTKVENLIDKAIEDNKITKESREDMLNEFGSDLERAEKLINSISIPVAKDISDEINSNEGDVDKNEDGKLTYQDKTFREWEKDDEGEEVLSELENSNKKLYDKLYAQDYESNE